MFQVRIGSNIVSRVYDERCLGFPKTYRRGGGLGPVSPFCRWLAFANEYIVVLSEDVEYERTFVAVYGLSALVAILRA
jgi:hypothetical protein